MKKHILFPQLLFLATLFTCCATQAQRPLDAQKLDHFFENYISEGRLAGISTRIWHQNQLIYKSNVGFQNLTDQTPITDQTLFRLASLTKPIVSVGAMILVDKGLLSLDDPVTKYLPAFKKTRVFGTHKKPKPAMTIRHLLSHSGGISSPLAGDEVSKTFDEIDFSGIDGLEGFVDKIATLPLGTSPGTRFGYSFSTDVLARVIEVVSGQSIDQYLQKQVFDPLEMTHTGFRVAPEQVPHFASIYRYDDQKQLQLVRPNDQSPYLEGMMPRGNFGLATTIGDYSKFALMLLHQGEYNGIHLLSAQTAALMPINQIPPESLPISAAGMTFKGLGFGLGVAVSYEPNPLGTVVGSYGWVGASHTYFWVDPVNEVVGVMFSQFNGRECPIFFQVNPLFYEAWGGGENENKN